ncbi:hypothetical protein HYR69_10530 [Candidatus Sumerlaeota bacterium]|nr:hypothetical protein [Candidatus Sumerlaeota bacterium]
MRKNLGFIIAGLALALFLVICVLPFASSAPDGLESALRDAGASLPITTQISVRIPFLDYVEKQTGDPMIARIIMGGIGTLLLFTFIYFGARFLAGRDKRPQAQG